MAKSKISAVHVALGVGALGALYLLTRKSAEKSAAEQHADAILAGQNRTGVGGWPGYSVIGSSYEMQPDLYTCEAAQDYTEISGGGGRPSPGLGGRTSAEAVRNYYLNQRRAAEAAERERQNRFARQDLNPAWPLDVSYLSRLFG